MCNKIDQAWQSCLQEIELSKTILFAFLYFCINLFEMVETQSHRPKLIFQFDGIFRNDIFILF